MDLKWRRRPSSVSISENTTDPRRVVLCGFFYIRLYPAPDGFYVLYVLVSLFFMSACAHFGTLITQST